MLMVIIIIWATCASERRLKKYILLILFQDINNIWSSAKKRLRERNIDSCSGRLLSRANSILLLTSEWNRINKYLSSKTRNIIRVRLTEPLVCRFRSFWRPKRWRSGEAFRWRVSFPSSSLSLGRTCATWSQKPEAEIEPSLFRTPWVGDCQLETGSWKWATMIHLQPRT